MSILKLRNHIPIGEPARREPADGLESYFRVSLVFEQAWYQRRCNIDFRKKWHTNPYYRYDCI